MLTLAVLSTLAVFVAEAEEEKAACPYFLVLGRRKSQKLRETMGYYMQVEGKQHNGVPAYTQIESLLQTCDDQTKTCSRKPARPAYIFGDEAKGLWMIGQHIGSNKISFVAKGKSDTYPFSTPDKVAGVWHNSDGKGGWAAAPLVDVKCASAMVPVEEPKYVPSPEAVEKAERVAAPVFSPKFRALFDQDGDDMLDMEELIKGFMVEKMFAGQEEVQAVAFFLQYDKDKDGLIDDKEWNKSWKKDGAPRMGGKGLPKGEGEGKGKGKEEGEDEEAAKADAAAGAKAGVEGAVTGDEEDI